MGAWIEIYLIQTYYESNTVAPLVGAWIEILIKFSKSTNLIKVAPLVGAWIEISLIYVTLLILFVAPLVGAWIEIDELTVQEEILECRSSRGSVD